MWMVYFSQFEIVETSFVTILMEFNDLGVGNTMKAAAKINNATLTHLEALVNLLSILLSSKLSIAERVDERWLQSAMFALWQARPRQVHWIVYDKYPMVLSIHPSLTNTTFVFLMPQRPKLHTVQRDPNLNQSLQWGKNESYKLLLLLLASSNKTNNLYNATVYLFIFMYLSMSNIWNSILYFIIIWHLMRWYFDNLFLMRQLLLESKGASTYSLYPPAEQINYSYRMGIRG